MNADEHTCTRCGCSAERSMGTEWLCFVCFEVVMAPIRARVFQQEHLDGVGLLDGQVLGPGEAELRCNSCSAGWIGMPGETCDWCERSAELARKYQHEIVLTPPDIEANDASRDGRIRAWVERLVRALEAELITEDEARDAVRHVK